MEISTRICEIENSLHSCSKNLYKRDEIIPNLMQLQDEIVNRVPDIRFIPDRRPQIWDAYDRLAELNQEKSGIATKELQVFKNSCNGFVNCIKGMKSGFKGEQWAFRKLEGLKIANRILKNVPLANEKFRSELDAVVITNKAAFIIEIKNTKRNVFIDENGQYYKTGEFLKWNSDIGYKARVKEHLLRMKLNDNGYRIPVKTIVVFSNDSIQVQNKCPHLTTCFMRQLCYLIEDFESEEVLTDMDMDTIADDLNRIVGRDLFPLGTDTAKLKHDFATLMAKLEMANELTAAVEKTTADKNTQPEPIRAKKARKHSVRDWFSRIVHNPYVRGSAEQQALS